LIRTLVHFVLGIGLTAAGALALRESWWGTGYFALLFGSAVLVRLAWRWLERDRDRLLRWSDEHRARAFARVSPPEVRPTPDLVMHGPGPGPVAEDGEGLQEPVEQVAAGQPAGK
jgi:hypothetical protein